MDSIQELVDECIEQLERQFYAPTVEELTAELNEIYDEIERESWTRYEKV